ncbi:putative Histidine kinase [Verrucomicrobia bacterium]|nr:putative Histidine kinase [Verrucomicrobiota bacterium]
MEMTRRSVLVYGLLAAVWTLVVLWQVEEHNRVKDASKADLRNRAKVTANTLSALIRGMRHWGAIPQERLELVIGEMVNGTNELVKSSELLSVILLNAANVQIASAGRPIDLSQEEIVQEGERWGRHTVTFVNPVDLGTNTILLPPRTNNPSNGEFHGPGFPPPPPEHGSEPPPPALAEASNTAAGATLPTNAQARADRGGPSHPPEGPFRPRRPPRLWGMTDQEYQDLVRTHALHGLVLSMSTESYEAALVHDLWLRWIIGVLATVSAFGSGLAWRNLAKSSDLEIRLVRASELNSHLKEMNLAAAGLAHETRNPLNIIRGLAQMIAKQPATAPEVQKKSTEIISEADKVAAQLNEFINYSRPREVRRSVLPLGSVINEVARALSYDLEEKKIHLEIKGEQINIEADEQLLRQALFNLLLNAVQAVNGNGQIQVLAQRCAASEALLEVRDNGPGVPPERRTEIFKPYFTTQKNGTGLGLAVVQQIVLAHGWEIGCLPNEPKGAVFRITHLKVAG